MTLGARCNNVGESIRVTNASLNFESFTHVHYYKYVFQQLLDILLKTAAEGGNVDPHKVREILTDGTKVVAPPTDETIPGA